MARKQAVGKWGEGMAEHYLIRHGCTLIERNVRTQYGEIDLVMKTEDNLLIFVEVKTRTSSRFGNPEEAITRQKSDHMRLSAEAYLLARPEFDGDWRIDVISIYRARTETPEIVWFENAIH
ncbi:MAG: YraN family protein [Anaerolineaceae bacterium]|jgi:putative endonuclease